MDPNFPNYVYNNPKPPTKRKNKKNPQNNPSNYQTQQGYSIQNPPNDPQNYPQVIPQNFTLNFEGHCQNYPPNLNFSQSSQIYGEYGSRSGFSVSRQSTPGRGDSTDDGCEVHDEDEDDDVEEYVPSTQMNFTELLSQPTPQPTRQPTEEIDKRIWSDAETNALISAYMNTTNDQVHGTSQTSNEFWGKVLLAYDAAREANPQQIALRTVGSVKGRWLRMAPHIVKWCGSVDKAKARRISGQGSQDVIAEAHQIHQNSFGKFKYYNEWLQIKKWDRYRSILQEEGHVSGRGRPSKKGTTETTQGTGSSGKRSRDEKGGSTPDTPTSGDVLANEFVPRPEGVKKAKSRLKGKDVATQALDTFESFGDKLKLIGEVRGKAADMEMERLELAKKKEARKQKQMNWEMLQQLQAKQNRAPWEERMIEQLQEYFTQFGAF